MPRGAFNEIWYHYHVAGRLQTGKFEPADAGKSHQYYVPPFKSQEKD